MKRMLQWGLALLLVGCVGQKKHPIEVRVEPVMTDGSVEEIVVFPFASTVGRNYDPDQRASETMGRLFLSELDSRSDYKFVAPSSLEWALEREGLAGESERFIAKWRDSKTADTEFLEKLAGILNVDAVLVGVVDLWQKDEVDVRENATPTTYVGATITILDTQGRLVFQAVDEDFVEGQRSEERTVMRSPSGQIYSDPSANIYRAPPFEEVAVKVARALVHSIPPR